MGSGFRPIYDDDAQTLVPDLQAGSFSASVHGIGVSASKVFPVYASNVIIIIDSAITGGLNTITQVDVNYSNIFVNAISAANTSPNMTYQVDKLLSQPSYNRRRVIYNPSFSANWVALTSIGTATNLVKIVDTPIRYLRLRGNAVSGAFVAYAFTDTYTQGV
jgi:hypothetical protein